MTYRTVARAALAYLAVVSAHIGFWALVAPRSFFEDYPGLGRHWVSIDGPYNEHLVRDIGALNLALLTLVLATAMHPTRSRLAITAIASLVWSLPHLAYHLSRTGDLGRTDAVVSVGGLVLYAFLAAALVLAARNEPSTGDSASTR